jgi:hypothetical protein
LIVFFFNVILSPFFFNQKIFSNFLIFPLIFYIRLSRSLLRIIDLIFVRLEQLLFGQHDGYVEKIEIILKEITLTEPHTLSY